MARKVGRNEPCPCGSGKKYKQRRTQSLRIAPCATTFPRFASLGFGIEDFSKSKVPRCGASGELYFSRGLEAETTPGYRGGAFESEDAVVAEPDAFADSPPVVGFDVRSRLTDSFCCENSYFPS